MSPVVDVPCMVLIMPDIHCDTGAVYRRLDALGNFDDLSSLSNDDLFRVGVNRLADAVYDESPALRQLVYQLRSMVDLPICLSGSGSTLFVPCDSQATGMGIQSLISSMLGPTIRVLLTHGIHSGL